MKLASTATGRSLAAAVGAMCAQSAWAAFANHSHGQAAMIRAAVTQGACSFGMTLFITLFLEFLLSKLQSVAPLPRALSVAAISVCVMITIQVTAHALTRTPELTATIAAPACIGTFYCASYAWGRVFLERPAQAILQSKTSSS